MFQKELQCQWTPPAPPVEPEWGGMSGGHPKALELPEGNHYHHLKRSCRIPSRCAIRGCAWQLFWFLSQPLQQLEDRVGLGPYCSECDYSAESSSTGSCEECRLSGDQVRICSVPVIPKHSEVGGHWWVELIWLSFPRLSSPLLTLPQTRTRILAEFEMPGALPSILGKRAHILCQLSSWTGLAFCTRSD